MLTNEIQKLLENCKELPKYDKLIKICEKNTTYDITLSFENWFESYFDQCLGCSNRVVLHTNFQKPL